MMRAAPGKKAGDLKLAIATELRKWRAQKGVSTNRMAQLAGVNESTLRDYLAARVVPSGERLRRLARTTRIPLLLELAKNRKKSKCNDKEAETVRREASSLKELLAALSKKVAMLARDLPAPAVEGSDVEVGTTERIQRIRQILDVLSWELDYFKNARAEQREQLRRALQARDVGYVSALLQALFSDEDEFQNWLFFADYSPSFVKR